MNIIKECYIHTWKCYNETPYSVQLYTLFFLKKEKIFWSLSDKPDLLDWLLNTYYKPMSLPSYAQCIVTQHSLEHLPYMQYKIFKLAINFTDRESVGVFWNLPKPVSITRIRNKFFLSSTAQSGLIYWFSQKTFHTLGIRCHPCISEWMEVDV
jgi:hypothetical protein